MDAAGNGEQYHDRRRKGLGFFPEPVIIRDTSVPRRPLVYEDSGGVSRDTQYGPRVVSQREYEGNPQGSRYDPQLHVDRPSSATSSSRTGLETPSSWDLWKEWHINPTGHGGKSGPPRFVPARHSYDELGRSIQDGYGVAVEGDGDGADSRGDEDGKGWKGKGEGGEKDKDKGEEKASGKQVADWYLSLSASRSGSATPVNGQGSASTMVAKAATGPIPAITPASKEFEAAASRVTASTSAVSTSSALASSASVTRVSATTPASASASSVSTASTAPASSSSMGSTPAGTLPATTASSARSQSPLNEADAHPHPRPLRVHSSEWFIRRALARKAQSDPSQAATPPPAASSIGSLINIPTTANSSANANGPQPRPARVRYALGPDNAGYVRLEEMGWGGGGLGRPEGWEARDGEGVEGVEGVGAGASVSRPASASRSVSKRARTESPDGTPDSDSESGSDSSSDSNAHPDTNVDNLNTNTGADPAPTSDTTDLLAELEAEAAAAAATSTKSHNHTVQDGPGRTLPVATQLKFDRLGLGRASGKHAEKRVTHTAAEIAAAQRRAARGGVKVSTGKPAEREGQGKQRGKEKVKWADKERREREHRRRLAAMLNG